MRPIKPAPYPKGKKVAKDDGENEHEELRVRQSFCIHVEDQIVWMAVYGVLGPYFEEDMPAWSYGNRLFLNTWKDEMVIGLMVFIEQHPSCFIENGNRDGLCIDTC